MSFDALTPVADELTYMYVDTDRNGGKYEGIYPG
jgi:hypothetical protein